MSGDTIAVLGVGVTLLAAILTFGFALLGAHRATQATVNGRIIAGVVIDARVLYD